MKTSRTMLDSHEVRSRAAEIRKRWTPEERQRRTGLPPDTPLRLRQFVLRNPKLSWQPAACDAARGKSYRAAN
jgi:hypothetical protein